jgi:HAD superfamily hydrolase (TIGR01484 family)
MKRLDEMDTGGVRVVLFDIDDTLTTQGKLTADAYGALEALQHAGLRTIAVSGRAAPFCEYAARMWPVEAVVGENGGCSFRFAGGKLHRDYPESPEVRTRNRERYAAIGPAIVAAVPGCVIAAGERYRETDLAIDYAEDVGPLPLATAERIAELLRLEGLRTAVSSIHVHGWLGDYDKLVTVRDLLGRRFEVDLDKDSAAAVYIGDSPNDAPMFDFFPKSVGVANVRRFAGLQPKYVTLGESGAGFTELARHLLRA